MRWDNSPVFRRRRRFLGAVALLVLVGLVWGVIGIGGALSPKSKPVAKPPKDAPVVRERIGRAAPITIAFAGDTQAHGEAGRINQVGLGSVGAVLAKADLAMVNLETVVAADTAGLVPQPKTYTFATDPQILSSLKNAGVDVVTAANNHGMDYGAEGMRRMLEVKKTSPVPIVGIGHDDAEAWAPWTTDVKGRHVVVFGATDVLDDHLDWQAGPGVAGLAKVGDPEGMAKLTNAVRAARAASPDDAIVVYLHSGTELVRCPTPRQRETARLLAEAGADVVIGSHAHLLQTTTTIDNTFVAYGLGNFVFSSHREQTRATGVLTVTIPGKPGPPSAQFDPASITKGVPVLLAGKEREKALAAWKTRGEGC